MIRLPLHGTADAVLDAGVVVEQELLDRRRRRRPILGRLDQRPRQWRHPADAIARKIRLVDAEALDQTDERRHGGFADADGAELFGTDLSKATLVEASLVKLDSREARWVDADLRGGRIHQMFGIENHVGLSTLLSLETSPGDSITVAPARSRSLASRSIA